MFLLDTDILSLLFHNNPKVLRRLAALPPDELISTSIIFRIETLRGRFDSMLKASNKEEWLRAQERLIEEERRLTKLEIVLIDSRAADEFERLKIEKRLRKMGRSDLLIDCIAIARRATLVTRNVKHFKLVPGLKIENWAD